MGSPPPPAVGLRERRPPPPSPVWTHPPFLQIRPPKRRPAARSDFTLRLSSSQWPTPVVGQDDMKLIIRSQGRGVEGGS
eukprot:scaffold17025_cov80-Isochrysis_galbana.AAC.1